MPPDGQAPVADVVVVHRALEAIGIEFDEAERDAAEVGPSTRAALIRVQLLLGLPPTGEPDRTTVELASAAVERLRDRPKAAAPGPGESLVEGTVYDADGFPLAGVTVVARRRTLRDAVELARSGTDADGRYSIVYPTPVDPSAPKAGTSGVDLQLDVVDATGALVFRSPVRHNVPPLLEETLALGGADRVGPAEHARVSEAVARLLGTLRPEEIVESGEHRDLTYLAEATGTDKAHVAFHSIAARLAGRTGLPGDLFYALFRQGVPADAETSALADTTAGVDLTVNGDRLLSAVFAADPEVRLQAVDAAVAAGVVSPGYAKRAKDDLANLHAQAKHAALAAPVGTYKTPVGQVLDAAGVPTAKQERFVADLRASRTPGPAFWEELAKQPGYTVPEVETLRFTMTVAQVGRGHLPLLKRLLAARQAGTRTHTRDLARLSATQWRVVLTDTSEGPPIGVPPNFTAANGETALDAYAQLLERGFERHHPTAAFSARLADDQASPVPAKAAVTVFLDGQPAFDLRRTDVDRYLKDNPAAAKPADRPALRESLLLSQRMAKVAGRYAVARPLLADKLHSAQHVYAMGRSAFLRKYASHADVGPVQAARVFARAEQSYATALSLAMNLNVELAGANPAALGPTPGETVHSGVSNLADFPNLQSLFGSLDRSTSPHCRSVLSPAAYFTDLLHFLSQRHVGGVDFKNLLLYRRPDLAQIELSCANSTTLMPQLDLVNEILEDAVAPPANPAAAARQRQTTLTAEELGAQPEYTNNAAYAKLASAVFPWRLPFDLPLAESRAYLGMLDTSRVQLLHTFRPPAQPGSAASVALAVEGLGMSALEADIVTAGPSVAARKSWEYWGLAETGNTVPDPVDPSITVTGTWIDVLSRVRIMLNRADLTYVELARVLNTTFVNPTGTVVLTENPDAPYDLATMRLTGLTANVLDRIHRFVRLWRRLGWDVYDLDAAVALLQAAKPEGLGRLNTELLRQLWAVHKAARRFAVPVRSALALFGRLDTRDVPPLPGEDRPRRSLYTDLFANLAVLNPPDPAFALNAARTEIAAAGQQLADHRPALVAALEFGDDDVLLAIGQLTDGKLNLANLTLLYRAAVLARGLDLPVRDLLAVRGLVESADPFPATAPEAVDRFCAEVDRIRASRFSVAELDFLFRHRVDQASGLLPDDVVVGTLLRSVRDRLATVYAEHAPAPDPTGGLVRRRLAGRLAATDVDAVMAVLSGNSTLTVEDQRTLVGAKLGAYGDVPSAQAALVGSAALPAGGPRHGFVLARLSDHDRRTLGTAAVTQELADALGIPTSVVAELVSDWMRSFVNKAQPMVDDFLKLPGIARDPARRDTPVGRDEPAFGPYFGVYLRLAKAARVLAGFGLSAGETSWLRSFGVPAGWLDPTALPVTPTAPEGRYAGWARLADAVAVRPAIGAGGAPFTALMDLARTGASKAEYTQALIDRTGWPAQSLRALMGDPANAGDRGLLDLAYPEDHRTETALARLVPAFALLDRLGVDANVSGWIGATVTPAQAQAIRQSVKARYSASQWPTVARPVRDVLREQQRDAMVAHLLAHPPAGWGAGTTPTTSTPATSSTSRWPPAGPPHASCRPPPRRSCSSSGACSTSNRDSWSTPRPTATGGSGSG
ncbi:hypothetical protein Pflav_047300 [Phytohabitans flavus]|uniref:Peptidoglycan binding-like domain-containing protein n=1 Tax=Phytohabitans flavus TaxID=1076124 RepID=A0A6F8XWY2_9ACTN|nr:hypothetical protein Pflav_047300 [Phytohabitans flavus]